MKVRAGGLPASIFGQKFLKGIRALWPNGSNWYRKRSGAECFGQQLQAFSSDLRLRYWVRLHQTDSRIPITPVAPLNFGERCGHAQRIDTRNTARHFDGQGRTRTVARHSGVGNPDCDSVADTQSAMEVVGGANAARYLICKS